MPSEYALTRSSARSARPTRSSAPAILAAGVATARGRVRAQVLAPGQVAVEARLLDDRADAGERGGALLGHRPPEQPHLPGRRPREAEQHADERRLARAVRPEEPERARLGHAQVDARDREPVAEALDEVVRLDHKAGSHATTLGRCERRFLGRQAELRRHPKDETWCRSQRRISLTSGKY